MLIKKTREKRMMQYFLVGDKWNYTYSLRQDLPGKRMEMYMVIQRPKQNC